jgi:hypothetical protein
MLAARAVAGFAPDSRLGEGLTRHGISRGMAPQALA